MNFKLGLKIAAIVCLSILGSLFCNGQLPSLTEVAPDPLRAEWMFQEAFFGAGTHYLGGGRDLSPSTHPAYRRTDPPTIGNWNNILDAFDVEELADDLQEAGVGWFFITTGQTRGFIMTHSEVYDENVPKCNDYETGQQRWHITSDVCPNWNSDSNPDQRADFTSNRDLISDLADALHKRGIRMMVYSTYEQPSRVVGNQVITRINPWWVAYHKEISERWGKKVDAWWIDGFYPEAGFPNDETQDQNGVTLQDFSNALRSETQIVQLYHLIEEDLEEINTDIRLQIERSLQMEL